MSEEIYYTFKVWYPPVTDAEGEFEEAQIYEYHEYGITREEAKARLQEDYPECIVLADEVE